MAKDQPTPPPAPAPRITSTRGLYRKARAATSEDWEARVVEYFSQCEETEEPVTRTGLAIHLGFSSLREYNAHTLDPAFADVAEWGLLIVEHYYELRLILAKFPGGAIFALKNMGWRDTQHLDAAPAPGDVRNSGDVAARLAGILALAQARKAQALDEQSIEELTG